MSSIENAAGAANLSAETIRDWHSAECDASGDFVADRRNFARFWQASRRLIDGLPPKTKRSQPQAIIADEIRRTARQSRERFLQRHVEAVYAALTQNFSQFVRVEDLVRNAATAFP